MVDQNRFSKSGAAITIVLITCGLFLTLDLLLTRTGAWDRIVKPTKSNAGAPPWRISDTYYHHGLDKNRDVTDFWGGKPYHLTTNSLGFKDSRVRQVSNLTPPCRTLFIGDSFTEGVGLEWDDTFVGMLQKQHPACEILNAAVSSYSPSIYRNKVAKLLADGLEIDRVVVFIDISDIQDEAVGYTRLENGAIGYNPQYVINYNASPKSKEPPLAIRPQPISNPSLLTRVRLALPRYAFGTYFTASLIKQAATNYDAPKAVEDDVPKDILNLYRSAWTYDKNSPGYGPDGVSSGIRRALDEMSTFSSLLSEHHIQLSIAVYPWPAQLVHDQLDSVQVKIWREFCQMRCEFFVNLFLPFFDVITGKSVNEWLPEFFIEGDVHFNRHGNELIANYLSKNYGVLFYRTVPAR